MAAESKRSGKSGGRKGADKGRTGAESAGAAAPSIDAVLGELESVVDQLEGGELPLEEALARFEAGVKLARDGAVMLDGMERRVEVLLADAHGGDVTRAPFASRADGDEQDENDEEDDDNL